MPVSSSLNPEGQSVGGPHKRGRCTMSNQVLNARKRLEREADPNSGHNLKLRRDAVIIADAICRNFPVEFLRREGTVRLSSTYSIFWTTDDFIHRPRRWVTLGRNNNIGLPLWRQLILSEENSLEDAMKTMSLDDARRFAEDINKGFLLDLIALTIRDRCNIEAAKKFFSALHYESKQVVL